MMETAIVIKLFQLSFHAAMSSRIAKAASTIADRNSESTHRKKFRGEITTCVR